MDSIFINKTIDIDKKLEFSSDKINNFIKKNNIAEITKAIDFLSSDGKFLYIHGFLGTGKRQFINYITEFLEKDVIKLEYYCKNSTVCDDIIISFINCLEKTCTTKPVSVNLKITTLPVKFQTILANINKPILIILHSFDDILEENKSLVINCLDSVLNKHENVKLILSTRGLEQDVAGRIKIDKKIFLRAFSKEIFNEFLQANNLKVNDATFEDFYKYTRGYYYYTALSLKIITAMKCTLNEFLDKFVASGVSFDEFLGITYINLIPTTIRNFFWFLRTIRHGLTLNALAVFELYDDFSIEYLKSNLMIFQVDDAIYVQDYFLQNIDISIPAKTEIKLHKYIINIYEKQLKEPLQTREVLISRQALRAEIDYHNKCIQEVEGNKVRKVQTESTPLNKSLKNESIPEPQNKNLIDKAKELLEAGNKTEAIEAFLTLLNSDKLNSQTIVQIRLTLANIYKDIEDYSKALHYYELVETYYKQHNEVINLNYLYYDITSVYNSIYKHDRAVETIKKVIYSIDTPQSLMVSACILLGNIYAGMNNSNDAYMYYKKALESLGNNTSEETLAELYFKLALVNDDRGEMSTAFDYYNKCISIIADTPYKSLAYSNLASCYYENENYSDARACFKFAYDIEKSKNNYEGICYTALHLAKIYTKLHDKQALHFYIEAKHSAEFLNEHFYIMEASIALGDYYYNNINTYNQALEEYFNAKKYARNLEQTIDITKIEKRIYDMQLRMDENVFKEIERKYE